MDEAISMVSAITGATPQVARHFLSMTDGDPQQAIQLFYDSPELSSSMAQPSSAPISQAPALQQRASSVEHRDPPDIINLDSDDEDVMMDRDIELNNQFSEDEHAGLNVHPSTALADSGNYEDDEAVARRIQEELYASGDTTGDFDSHGVRAPLARTTETLIGPGADWTPEDMHDAVLQQMRARQQPRSSMSF